jgi:hypothetical protein
MPCVRLGLSLGAALAAVACDEGQVVHRLEPSLERMMDQPRADPFAPSTVFEDGRAMRTPPEGTLPTEEEAPPYRVDGGYVRDNPFPLTREFLLRGRSRFEVTCAACHGILGDGESVVATKMELRPPPSLHIDRIRALDDGRIEEVIERGYGFMSSYAPFLTAKDRWAVVAYVRALQLSQRAPVASLPPDIVRELEERAP